MKYLALILLTLAVVWADHHDGHHHHEDYVVKTKADLQKFRDHCVEQLGIPEDLVTKYKRWEYPDDEKTHCYMKCVFEQFGFFDEHNGFDVKKIHHQLVGDHSHVDHEDATHKQIEECADHNTQGSSACEWAYRGGLCVIKNNLPLVKESVKA